MLLSIKKTENAEEIQSILEGDNFYLIKIQRVEYFLFFILKICVKKLHPLTLWFEIQCNLSVANICIKKKINF